ncbi:MAG: hypothetical protein ACO3NK_03785 [Prochlorotrichaceae cyanobacterium]
MFAYRNTLQDLRSHFWYNAADSAQQYLFFQLNSGTFLAQTFLV